MLRLVVLCGIASCTAAFSKMHPPPKQSGAQSSASFNRLYMGAGTMVDLDDSNYRQLLKGNEAVLVDVCAPWCGPCKLIEPVLERCGEKWGESLTIVKYDVESKNLGVISEFVRHDVLPKKLPALILFQNGKVVANKAGIVNDESLNDLIKDHLDKESAQEQSTRGLLSFTHAEDDYMLPGP